MHGRHLEASFAEQYLQYNERSSKIGEPIRSWFSYTDRSLPKAGIARVYVVPLKKMRWGEEMLVTVRTGVRVGDYFSVYICKNDILNR